MKILVVALHNLGDAVMSAALIPALRRARPGAELGLWVKEYARGLFDLAGVRLHAADPFWDSSPGRGKGAWGPFLRSIREIRSVGYDCALVLDADWRRALACRWAGVPVRVGCRRKGSGLFLTTAVEAGPPRHVVEEHAALLDAWLDKPVSREWLVPEIGLTLEQERSGDRWRSEQGWQDASVIAAHLVTGDAEKNWPLQKWLELMRAVTQGLERARIVILSSPKEESRLRSAFSGSPQDRVRIFVGGVSELKPVLSQADLFVGGDSGPGHMAAALGAPVVSLFGPTDPDRYRPVGRQGVTILRREPIGDLPVEDVLEAVRKALSASTSKRP